MTRPTPFFVLTFALAAVAWGQIRSENYQWLLQNAAQLSGDPIPQGKCGLPAFSALYQTAVKHQELAALFKATVQRPQLPLSYVTPDRRFRIHYAVTGADSVNPASTIPEAVAAGVPDYIYETGVAAQRAQQLLVTTLGFDPPMSDRGVDGPEYDFYVDNRPGSEYGRTEWDFLDVSGRAPGYSFVDNDFVGYNTTGLAALRVTVAHEYFHGVQLNYRFHGEDIFFLEMSSVWFEDFAYDQVNDYYFYLRDFFNNPDRALHETDGYESAIWLHYLVKRLRTSRIMLDLWKNAKLEPAIRSFKTVLESSPYKELFAPSPSPFSQAFSEFYNWCYFTGRRADSSRYFEEGANYPPIKIAQTLAVSRDMSIDGALPSAAAQFYRLIRNPQNIQVFLQTGEPSRWLVTTISRNSQQYILQNGGGLTPITVAAPAREDSVVVAVVNVSLPSSSGQTIFFNYQLLINLTGQFQIVSMLEKPRPNPYRGGRDNKIVFPFHIDQRMPVNAVILREDGKVIKSYKFADLGAGFHSELLSWDGRDGSGNRVASGVYFLRLMAGNFHQTAKFVVVN